jgi:protein tyrosine/serine phosphatase
MVKLRRKRAPSPILDLANPTDRRRAWADLTWGDHGFLRARFSNLHRISDEMWRSNQPGPRHIAEHAQKRGIRTIINLRGRSEKGYWRLEDEACRQHGIALIDFQMYSRELPTAARIHEARELFETIACPALMHCKSGADRAGIMAVLYMHFRKKLPIAQAVEQLSFRYLHVRQGRTGVLDALFETYLTRGAPLGLSFIDWVDSADYDPAAIKSDFLASGKARLGLDTLLRRE